MFKVAKNIPPPDLWKELKKGYCSLKGGIHQQVSYSSMLPPYLGESERIAQMAVKTVDNLE